MSIEETGNVDVTISSPLPAAETESVSETVVEEVIQGFMCFKIKKVSYL